MHKKTQLVTVTNANRHWTTQTPKKVKNNKMLSKTLVQVTNT